MIHDLQRFRDVRQAHPLLLLIIIIIVIIIVIIIIIIIIIIVKCLSGAGSGSPPSHRNISENSETIHESVRFCSDNRLREEGFASRGLFWV